MVNKHKQQDNIQCLLVTGGAGFIGGNFIRYWLSHHPNDKVIVLDALTYAGCKASLADSLSNDNCAFVKGSIGDSTLVKTLINVHGINTIVNFAAESHVDRAITAADDFIETNIVGTYKLLEAAKSIWLGGQQKIPHRFHHISTDEVFGSLDKQQPAFTEQHQYQPNSPYSASKAASDHLIRAYHHTYGLNVTTSHCSNNYGRYQFPEKLIPLVLMCILHEQPIPIYGDGRQVRDWLHVDDHCRAIELILTKGKTGESYNIGGNNEWQNIALVKQICHYINQLFNHTPAFKQKYPQALSAAKGKSEQLINFVADRLGHDKRYAINANKIARELGFVPNITLEQGLKNTLKWYLTTSSWWQPLYRNLSETS